MGQEASSVAPVPPVEAAALPDPPAASILEANPAADSASSVPPEPVPLLERHFLRRLQRSDPRAFREFVQRHQDRVYSLSLRMLGDAREAEDVGQEVFLLAHKHLPRFRGQCRLSTWLYRVTRNQCLNRLKYLARREGEELPGDDSQAAGGNGRPPASHDRPDLALLGAEERWHVQAALNRLSTEHRLLVVLRDIEGLSYDEIARIVDVPDGTVKSRLHRARAALADLLEAAGMAPNPTGAGR